MKKTTFIFIALVFVFSGILGFIPVEAGPLAGEEPPVEADPNIPNLPIAINAEDQYGYTYDSPVTLQEGIDLDEPWWVDPNDMLPVSFFLLDGDALSDPVKFANPDETDSFTFPFYENIYDQVYVSMNGVIRFTDQNAIDKFNYPLPSGNIAPSAPTNMIAVFWTDFDINEPDETPATEVKYKFFSDLGGGATYVKQNTLVIEWFNLRQPGTDDLVDIGVALQESGDIFLLYKTLPVSHGNHTIGIQDIDGEDGLMYGYNQQEISLDGKKALQIVRSSPRNRVKTVPSLQGAFTENGQANFSLNLLNISDIDEPNDIYDLTYECEPVNPCWDVKFFDGMTMQLLEDSNGNLGPETSPVLKGESIPVIITVTAPLGVQPGDGVDITITAESENKLAKALSKLQVAVPTTFVEAFQDGYGARAGYIWKLNQFVTPKINSANNNNQAIVGYSGGSVLAWNEESTVGFAYLDQLGFVDILKGSIIKGLDDTDRNPALSAVNSSGEVGMAWLRKTKTQTTEELKLMFAVLQPNPANPYKLNPVDLYGPTMLDLPEINSSNTNYIFPAITALDDDSFLIAWTHIENTSPTEEVQQLMLAQINSSGTVEIGPTVVHISDKEISGVSLETQPGQWTGKQAILCFVELTSDSQDVYYAGVKNDLLKLSLVDLTKIASSAGGTYFTTSLQSIGTDKILMAWLDQTVAVTSKSGIEYNDQGVKYGLLTNALTLPVIHEFMSPNLRQADNVSVGVDQDGRGIIIWSDLSPGKYFYYALIDSFGSLITKPMIYTTMPGGGINLSSSGQGLAFFGGRYQVFLPNTMK